MHATTGTRMLSTINTFLYSPRNVSAHLVIGKNGRILQMVPFNHAANHTGGFWERQPVRPSSIGIEMDNACDEITKHQNGAYSNRGVALPASEICETRYWKDNRVRPWQIYPPIQVQVTQAAVQALKAAYLQIDELLEHERINIRNRADPGPLFDMDALRQAALGKAGPAFKVHKTKRETALYENACYLSPELNVSAFLKPLPECLVEVLRDECDYWIKIKVHKCEQEPGFKDKSGWVRKNDVKFYQEVQGKKLYNMKR